MVGLLCSPAAVESFSSVRLPSHRSTAHRYSSIRRPMGGPDGQEDATQLPINDFDFFTNLKKSQAAAKQQQPQTFWQKLDAEVWDMFYGKKERQWNPDRRPVELRGRYDKSRSQLSWGSPNELTEAMMQELHAEAECAADKAADLAFAQPFTMQESPSKMDPTTIALNEQLDIMVAYADVSVVRYSFLTTTTLTYITVLLLARYSRQSHSRAHLYSFCDVSLFSGASYSQPEDASSEGAS
jgi:hypothetical protein